MPRATGYPAYRELARRVSDVLAVLLAAASAVNSAYRFSAHPDPALVIVLALTAVPLYVRRTWPVPVFGIILAACIGTAIWGSYRTIDGLALLFALYTVAALRPLRQALACAGVLAAGIVGIAVAVGGSSWWYDAILVCGLYGAGLGLGLYSGTRRAYLAELTDRAARLERERDQQGELAAAAERARIAREMHDIVAHNLTVMVTLSEAATAAAASSPERAAEAMRSLSATGRRALADTRRLLGVLRQDPGGDLRPVPGLAQLDGLIEQVRSAGLDTTLEITGPVPDLPEGVQLTVYRLVQEALTNTLKHAGPGATATVGLRFSPGELRVEVDDDGAGSASGPGPGPGGAPGGGLLGMRERVRAYGGEVRAGPREPHGWRVCARLDPDAS